MSNAEHVKHNVQVRIAGVVLPNKRTVIALTYVHGIGLTVSKRICAALKLSEDARINTLDETILAEIRDYISKNYVIEGDLRKTVVDNIKNLVRKGTYRGSRHKKGLPVRGQRTKTNARTRKGRIRGTVANKKKVTK